ncbi:inositol monophosphatase family protein [Reinekea thalattae]|uniref:Inositol-1-monophosphatase n=1 Tax=Reinekea thalattae TaxID=2593301 RepID=A0A5C8ZBE3_9GAMM|nr:inositol monophosphatase family protein [Reinekea thalattae]TXR54764.1 inositol monophosphatase [Reinekea thalattae]
MTDYQPMLTLALTLAKQAGEEIKQLRKSLTIEFKFDDTELVTQADVAADKLISEGIQASFAGHDILSEELAPNSTTECEHLWVIDPIDGTVNYAHGHHQVAISIAYFYQGDCKVAVVHNPFTEETFSAIQGKGALLNGQAIQPSGKNQLHRAIVATGFPYQKDNIDPILKRVEYVLKNCADLRRIGAAALDICWVACGRMDAYFESVKPWDFAAAQLIAREAGAQFGHFIDIPEGENPQLFGQNILVTTPAIYSGIQGLLAEADAQ